jgi:hypothetical protein
MIGKTLAHYEITSQIGKGGMGKVEQIASMPGALMWPRSISKNGNPLFFGQRYSEDSAGRYSIGMLPMEGDHTPNLLLQEEYIELYPQISPDERWLAYHSNEMRQYEIYIRSFPDVEGGRKEEISTDGGRYPRWSPDGKELFYRSSGELMVVPIETDPDLKLGNPQRLFDMQQYFLADIDPEGKQFLKIKGVEEAEDDSLQDKPRKIIVVTNWFKELNENVPVD